MANDFDAMKPTYWSKRVQSLLRTRTWARTITSAEERGNLSNGLTVNRPRPADVTFESLTFGDGSYTRVDRTHTQESLTINNWDAVTLTYTKDQMVQMANFPSRVNEDIDRAAFRLNINLERAIAGEYASAGTNTTAAIYTKADIYDGLAEAHGELRGAGVESDRDWYILGDSNLTTLIQQSNAGRETVLGDERTKMGFGFSEKYAGFRVYEANNSLTWTGNINIATNPTANDTVVIDGVTFTFVASPSAAGDVDIAGTAAGTVDNLVALINDPTTTTAGGVALSTANAAKFQTLGQTLISATDNTTSIALTSTKGRITLSETFTAAGDNVSDMVLHCLGGRLGNIDLVLQRDIVTEIKDVSGALKKDYVSDFMYGIKTFAEGAERMIDFRVRTAADTATS